MAQANTIQAGGLARIPETQRVQDAKFSKRKVQVHFLQPGMRISRAHLGETAGSPSRPADCLPPNAAALAMHLHQKASVGIAGILAGHTRSTVSVRLRQFALRHGSVLTAYSAQSSQFIRFSIYEATPTDFYSFIPGYRKKAGSPNSIAVAYLKEAG